MMNSTHTDNKSESPAIDLNLVANYNQSKANQLANLASDKKPGKVALDKLTQARKK